MKEYETIMSDHKTNNVKNVSRCLSLVAIALTAGF